MTITTTAGSGYTRALAVEPRLRALDRLVHALAANPPHGQPMCHGCLWEEAVKPLVTPLLGWDRGYLPEQAEDHPDRWQARSLAELMAADHPRVQAETETERWLRSSEAYDIVTDRWLRLLEAADPGLGHGFPGPGTPAAAPASFTSTTAETCVTTEGGEADG